MILICNNNCSVYYVVSDSRLGDTGDKFKTADGYICSREVNKESYREQ